MLLSIEGDESTGKSTLAYSGPIPVVGFAFDMGAKRAMMGGRFKELFDGVDIHHVPYDTQSVLQGRMEGETGLWEGHDITVFELPPPIQLDSIRVKGYLLLWTYFIAMCAKALMANQVKTIVVDTMTVARRVKADAYLESLQNVAFDPTTGERIIVQGQEMKMRERLQQIEYGNPNDAIRDIFSTGAGVDKNLIAVHHLTDEYATRPNAKGELVEVATGKRVLEGLKNTHRFVDICVLMSKDAGHIKGKFLKFGYNLPMEGTTQDDPTWDTIADLVAMTTGDRIQLDRRAE
ncbi:hypothetical protein LCGC14_2035370 [marine sediment metagenome]|uniref:Uncharacterized protein n=1 Tax=marine sediment metagenome TaxID=412755 RepID=A0A0F9HQG5_9ZZZZ